MHRYAVSPLISPVAAGSFAAAPGIIQGPVIETPGLHLVNAVSPLSSPIAAGSLVAAPGIIQGPVIGTPGLSLVNAVNPLGSPVAQGFPSAMYSWDGAVSPRRSSLTHSLGASWSY